MVTSWSMVRELALGGGFLQLGSHVLSCCITIEDATSVYNSKTSVISGQMGYNVVRVGTEEHDICRLLMQLLHSFLKMMLFRVQPPHPPSPPIN